MRNGADGGSFNSRVVENWNSTESIFIAGKRTVPHPHPFLLVRKHFCTLFTHAAAAAVANTSIYGNMTWSTF